MLDRNKIRDLKSYQGFRWLFYKLNKRNQNKVLHQTDQFVLKNLQNGISCCIDDLPKYYSNIISNLYYNLDDNKFDNIISINSSNFRYKTLTDINDVLLSLTNNLTLTGQLIFSLNLDNLKYDRANISLSTLFDQWASDLKTHNLILKNKLINFNLPAGFGHCFFVVGYDGKE
jgi:hypothetical protein